MGIASLSSSGRMTLLPGVLAPSHLTPSPSSRIGFGRLRFASVRSRPSKSAWKNQRRGPAWRPSAGPWRLEPDAQVDLFVRRRSHEKPILFPLWFNSSDHGLVSGFLVGFWEGGPLSCAVEVFFFLFCCCVLPTIVTACKLHGFTDRVLAYVDELPPEQGRQELSLLLFTGFRWCP